MVTHPRTIVILGGGVSGVVAAREIRRRIPRPHRIVLVAEAGASLLENCWLHTKRVTVEHA